MRAETPVLEWSVSRNLWYHPRTEDPESWDHNYACDVPIHKHWNVRKTQRIILVFSNTRVTGAVKGVHVSVNTMHRVTDKLVTIGIKPGDPVWWWVEFPKRGEK